MTGTNGLGLRVQSLVLVSTPGLPLGRLQISDVYGSLQLCLGDRNYSSSVSFSICEDTGILKSEVLAQENSCS